MLAAYRSMNIKLIRRWAVAGLILVLAGCVLTHNRSPGIVFQFQLVVPTGSTFVNTNITWLVERQFPLTDDERRVGTPPHPFTTIATIHPLNTTPRSDRSFVGLFLQPPTGPTSFGTAPANYRVRCRAYVGPAGSEIFVGEAASPVNFFSLDQSRETWETFFDIVSSQQSTAQMMIRFRGDLFHGDTF
jgi:hypothetical protein